MREIRVDEHITLILQFAKGACSNVRPKSGIKGTYTTYGEQLNSVGKISYDAPTGHTCSIVGLIPKIEQNFLFPLPVPKTIVSVWGWGSVIQCPFPLFPNHWEGTRYYSFECI